MEQENNIANEPIEPVEEEDVGPAKITDPYNPEEIKIDQKNFHLGTIIEMLEYKEIDLMPDFQRNMDLWDDTKKSRLIESLLLGLPIPSFYFSEEAKDKKWLVVDGLQRLCAFQNFVVDKKLKLSNLQFLESYDNKSYEDLSREEKRKISGTQLNCYVIQKKTPSNVKFLIFQRINTGGLILTAQEIRHALNQGISADFIKELAETKEFKRATCNKIPSKRMLDRDFINRFVAFYRFGYDKNYKGDLDKFLNEAMEKLAKLTKEERENIKKAFKKSMILAHKIFGDDAFRKRYNKEDKRKPISKSVFDAISVNFALLDDKQQDELLKYKEGFKYFLMLCFNKKEFDRAVSSGTGQKTNVIIRFGLIKDIIKKTIDEDKRRDILERLKDKKI